MTLASDRIQLIDYPYGLPSKCAVCGGGGETGRKFVDFGFSLDYYGAVYFCDLCITTISEAIGYVTPVKYDVARQRITELEEQNEALASENEGFRNAYSTLSGAGIVLPAVRSRSDGGIPDDSSGHQVVFRTVRESELSKQRIDESGSVEGHRDIPESPSPDGDVFGDDPDPDFGF